jgi:hypothetical protein
MIAIGTCVMFAERLISSEAAYRAFQVARLRKSRRQPQLQSEPLLAGLDCGVWLAWCPCGNGVGVDPRWGFAGCACGRSWERIDFPAPALLEQLDAVLALRPAGSINKSPVRWYSWRPGETVGDLIRENLRHGWPIPEGALSWP